MRAFGLGKFIVNALAITQLTLFCQGPNRQRLSAGINKVALYGLFEIAVRNPRFYDNPFTDVTLEAGFSGPFGTARRVFGFYDGGGTWRIRFMPDTVGEWRYRFAFSDGSASGGGSFQVSKSLIPGPLKVRQDNRLWFEHRTGTPVYLLSFHLWNIDAIDPQILAATLDFLKTQGFNAIVGPHLGPPDRLPWEKRNGKIDFSRMNLALWKRLDTALRLLSNRQMVLIPFSMFGGTNRMPKIPTREQEDMFLRYWVARWGGFWNATFQPTSEWEEGFSRDEIMRIGQNLYDEDQHRHLISVHSLRASDETVQKAEWYDYHTIQDKLDGWNPEKYRWFADLFRQVPKPIFAHECLWEGNYYQKEAGLDRLNMRRGAWFIALNGGQINYADEVVFPRRWQDFRTEGLTFSELGVKTKPLGLLYPDLTFLASFIRSLPFWTLQAMPELADSGACLADPGRLLIAYEPGIGRISLYVASFRTGCRLEWWDAGHGRLHSRQSFAPTDRLTLTPPGPGDWVLLIRPR